MTDNKCDFCQQSFDSLTPYVTRWHWYDLCQKCIENVLWLDRMEAASMKRSGDYYFCMIGEDGHIAVTFDGGMTFRVLEGVEIALYKDYYNS